MNRDYFKVEGNMFFPDDIRHILTWGPYYYHSEEKARKEMPKIFDDIINWANLKDSSLNIQATDIVSTRNGNKQVFKTKAWQTESNLVDVTCMISIDRIFFRDEDEN